MFYMHILQVTENETNNAEKKMRSGSTKTKNKTAFTLGTWITRKFKAHTGTKKVTIGSRFK